MKKNIFFTVIISLSLVFASCGSSNSSDYENDDFDNVETTDYDDENNTYDDDEGIIDEDIIDDEYVFTGTYDSKTGVMVDISCYCFQVGYFHADNGEEFAICFPDEMEEASCSENLEIEGYFEYVEINPESTSPCQAGGQEIFKVIEYRCL